MEDEKEQNDDKISDESQKMMNIIMKKHIAILLKIQLLKREIK